MYVHTIVRVYAFQTRRAKRTVADVITPGVPGGIYLRNEKKKGGKRNNLRLLRFSV